MSDPAPWWEGFFDSEYVRLWGQVAAAGDEEAAGLWRALGLSRGSRVLDAPCGYGRVSLPLARLGASVLGVDQSAVLLEQAERERGELGPDHLRYRRHDLRERLDESGFDAALNLFSSLGYGTEAEDVAILDTLRSAVRPGGTVAVETAHRDLLVLRLARGEVPDQHLPDGTHLVETPRFDPIAGRVETTWRWSGPAGAGEKSGSIRIYAISELVRLMERAGLRFRSALNSRSWGPYEATGPMVGGRVLLIGERPGAGSS